jgi:hypothetical protein
MKYQPQHDLLDPDMPSPAPVDLETEHDPDALEDAYVIGEHGNTVRAPNGRAAAGADEQRPKPWVKPAAFGLAAAFVVLTSLNLSRLTKGTPPPPIPTEFQVKQTVYMGVMKVENYRRVHGATPETLEAAGLPVNAGFGYVRIDLDHYLLSFQTNGPKVEYDSNIPRETFFGSPRSMLTIGEAQ